MSDKQPQAATVFGLRLFDLIVLMIAAILVVAVLIVWYFVSPARLGKMVAYLAPASGDVPNIWLVPVDNPDDARQVTFVEMGIYDFDVDGRGQTIAYSARDEVQRARDIYTLDLTTGVERRVTFCGEENAECYTPAFHPDDPVIAYVRVENGIQATGGSAGAPRVWVLDLVTGTERQLAPDSQLIGHSPIWSDSGDTIVFYSADLANPGVLVYNFNPQVRETQTLNFVPASNGSVGSLSPNGLRLIVPDIVQRESQIFTYLKLVDFREDPVVFTNFTDPNGVTDDIVSSWHPDGQRITVGRRYTDERWTRGYQLFEIDVNTGEITTLLFDERFGHYYFDWDNEGEDLLMQRLPILAEDGSINNLARPEVWVMNYETGDLIRVADSAYYPRWVLPR
ncbi:MAG: TolB family protein [Anaerolineae bacterium]